MIRLFEEETSPAYEVDENGHISYDGSLQDEIIDFEDVIGTVEETVEESTEESSSAPAESLEESAETDEVESTESLPVDSDYTAAGDELESSSPLVPDSVDPVINLYSAEDGSLAYTTDIDSLVLGEEEISSYSSTSGLPIPESGVISLEVRFNGIDYTAVFASSARESLTVVDGLLFNIGPSNVTGRLFSGDSWSSGSYGTDYITLLPILNTGTSTTVYRYGNYNYRTTYYYSGSGSSLGSSTTYSDVQVVSGWNGFYSEAHTFLLFFVLALIIILSIVRRRS